MQKHYIPRFHAAGYGALAAGVLAVSPQAAAQIEYKDIDPDVALDDLGGAQFLLDIDANDHDDLDLNVYGSSETCGYFFCAWMAKRADGLNGVQISSNGNRYPLRFQSGDHIVGSHWGPGGHLFNIEALDTGSGDFNLLGEWKSSGEGHLGLRIPLGNGHFRNAWVRLRLVNRAGSGLFTQLRDDTLYVLDYAYEQTPDRNIDAGANAYPDCPAMPTGLNAISRGRESAFLQWAPQNNAVAYGLKVWDDSNHVVHQSLTSETSKYLTGLPIGREFGFKIESICSDSSSVPSEKYAFSLDLFNPEQLIYENESSGLRQLEVADLDNDGDLDLISTTPDQDKIAWHENLDHGKTWTTHVLSSTADDIRGVHAADMNADGVLDIVMADHTNDAVAWLRGLGGGSFGALEVVASALLQPGLVVALDADADGDQDLAVATSNDGGNIGKVYALENLGGGSAWGPAQELARGDQVHRVDVDGDAFPDLLIARDIRTYTWAGRITWLEANGSAPGAGSAVDLEEQIDHPGDMAMGDIDSDGFRDLIFAEGKGSIAVARQLASGGFAAPYRIDRQRGALLASTDVNGDGIDDVLIGANQRITVLIAKGDGRFREGRHQTGQGLIKDLLVADLDQDGDADAVVATDKGISWFANLQVNNPDTCAAPDNPTVLLDGLKATMTWSMGTDAQGYRYAIKELGGAVFEGSTKNNLLAQFGPLNPGSYYAWKTAMRCANGSVSGYSVPDTFLIPALRVAQETPQPTFFAGPANAGTMRIAPNPASNTLHVRLVDLPKATAFEVLDLTGIRRLSGNLAASGNTHRIDLHALPSGPYLLRVLGPGTAWRSKAVVFEVHR